MAKTPHFMKAINKARKKRRKKTDQDFIVFNLRGFLFTLKEKHSEYEAPALAQVILSESRKGKTLLVICKQNWMFEREVITYAEKHPVVKQAIIDSEDWLNATAIELLMAASRDKTKHSPQMMKLLMSSTYGIDEKQEKDNSSNNINDTLRDIAEGLPD